MRRSIWLMVWLGVAPAVALARTPSPTRPPTNASQTAAEPSTAPDAAAEETEPYEQGPERVDRLRLELLPEYARTLTRLLGRGIEVHETRGRREGRLRVQLHPRGAGARLRLFVEF